MSYQHHNLYSTNIKLLLQCNNLAGFVNQLYIINWLLNI